MICGGVAQNECRAGVFKPRVSARAVYASYKPARDVRDTRCTAYAGESPAPVFFLEYR